jgi:POT family proton-dependent oligopeptide transporter
MGIIVSKPEDEAPKKASWTDRLHPKETWLEKRKKELRVKTTADAKTPEERYTKTTFCGGQPKLEGAKYFWFFSALMGATALLFIPFAAIYRPKNFLQESSDPEVSHR